MTKYTVLCTETIYYFGKIAFQKGHYYPATVVHDLLQFKGEMSFIQLENYEQDEWFTFHFQLIQKTIHKKDRLIS